MVLNFQSERDVTDVYESIQKLTCIGTLHAKYRLLAKVVTKVTREKKDGRRL